MEKIKSPFDAFSNSGRFISRTHFLEKYPDAVLDKDCTDIIMYHNLEQNIQVLSSGEFYYDDNIRGFVLDDVELELFTKKFNK
jgi:hypothetical protein